MEKLKERVSILEVKVDGIKTETAGFQERFNKIDAEFVSIHEKIADSRTVLESKIADCRSSLESKITDTSRYIAEMKSSLEIRITDIHGKISDLHGKISDLHKSITNQTRWMVGIMGSLVAAFVGALITAAIQLGPVLKALTQSLEKSG